MNHDEFWAFVRRPSLRKFRTLRRRAVSSDRYDPQALTLHQLHQWCHAEDWLTVRLAGITARGVFQTSPRFHFLLGQAEEGLGDVEGLGRCRRAFRSCLQMLLQTGDGTVEHPREAAFVTDINDVALALNLEVLSRQTLQQGTRTLDLVTAEDGQQLWFDVTEMTRRASQVARQWAASQV
jgi:hypothetical protein